MLTIAAPTHCEVVLYIENCFESCELGNRSELNVWSKVVVVKDGL